MADRTREMLEGFENKVQELLSELSETVTYNDLVEYFEDTKLVDLW